MHVDYTKICRVCMAKGSRDIFVRSIENGNPLERLLEKLRYVTMMKIEEQDDLPRLLCDLCIVQLNVAYNFKRQAIENDTKLRQYFIENGIRSSHLASSNINESSLTSNTLNETFTSSTNSNVSTVLPQQKKNFPIMPIIIKTEPTDNNVFNRECSAVSSATSLGTSSNSSPPDKMVYLNNYDFNSLTPTSDVEILHQNDTSNLGVISTEIDSINGQKLNSSNDTLMQNVTNTFTSKGQNIKTNLSNTRKQLAKKRLGGQIKTKRVIADNIRLKHTKQKITPEMKKLSINMVSPMGKLSRKEMKKNVNYTALFYQKKIHKGTNIATSNIKTFNTKLNPQNIIVNEKVILNPFNESNKIKKKGRPSKSCARQFEGTGTELLKPKIEPDTKS